MRGHVGAEAMADFRAGLLPARKAAAISAHLSACPRCAELAAQLASVTSLLAAAPAPPMPASLVARLDAALAAEAAARAAGTATATADAIPPAADTTTAAGGQAPAAATRQPAGRPVPPGIPGPPGHRRPAAARRDGRGRGHAGTRPPYRLVLRLVTAVTAIALVAGGGYAIARVVSGGTPATTAGPGLSAPHSAASQSPAPRAAAPRLAPAATAPAGAGLPVVRSGTSYRAGQLPAQVRSVLRRFAAAARSSPAARAREPVAGPAGFPQLAACVRRVAGGAVPRLVDLASYGGRPVAVIVVPVPGSSAVRVWLVGTACPAHGGDVIAHFSMPGTG